MMHSLPLVVLSVALLAAGVARCEICDDMYGSSSCTNQEFKNAVDQALDKKTNRIVAEGVMEALEEGTAHPAVAYGAPPHWLCDSDAIKQVRGSVLLAPGKGCSNYWKIKMKTIEGIASQAECEEKCTSSVYADACSGFETTASACTLYQGACNVDHNSNIQGTNQYVMRTVAGGVSSYFGGTFAYGETCKAVTGNIRQLVKFTKEKEIQTGKEADKTKKELLATNTQLTKDIQARRTAQNNMNNAQHQVNVMNQHIRNKQNEINNLNNEIRRIQDQINRDSRDIFKVIAGLIGGLIGIRDNRKNDVNNKRNEVNRMNNQLRSFQNVLSSHQRQVNSFNSQITTLQNKIANTDKQIKYLGQRLTKLRGVEQDLNLIAAEWSELDEGCEDIEDDLLLFEDLTLSVQEKVEAQAVKLSKLICGNAVG